MKSCGWKNVFKIAVWTFVGGIVLVTCTSEYQGKLALRRDARSGTPLQDFTRKYGQPRYVYADWQVLPETYRELFVEPLSSEDTFHSYQREGLPNYWSFVISVKTNTQTIQRFVCWKAIALAPEER